MVLTPLRWLLLAADFTIKQNDTTPIIQATCKDQADVVVNLTGSIITFKMVERGGTTLTVNASATIVNALGGIVKYTWVPGNTSDAGGYDGEFQVTFAGGDIETYPNDRQIDILITPDLP